ncbi:LysM peptidoglycan-binding domain-containing protein [Flavobacterium sp.]|uniref:LysM peptidoglycan-binding domain-containing protein n=1 Tax=Flavobacterium sp. TaxID=239 RepID=UPI002607C387|nr:LysM peptidoglycan-binding domain-containing protein [Flavobacterium sp.]MDD3003380.1 LysM peptidoglycan-binding domain-containing protein [Flavobacterium sp.]
MRISYLTFLLLFLLSSKKGFAQQNSLKNAVDEVVINHTVEANETKYGLSKKYNVSIQELERQNPQIVPVLKKGDNLKIRIASSKSVASFNEKPEDKSLIDTGNYLVKSGETLYGISRKFGISVSELIQMNKGKLGPVLLSGQTLNTPLKNQQQPVSENNAVNYHIVEAGQTKYGLSKKYAISINELERLNPHIIDMLRTGQRLTIPGLKTEKTEISEKNSVTTPPVVAEKAVQKSQPVVPSTVPAAVSAVPIKTVSYQVKPQETIYGLTKMTGLTSEKLIELNPELNNGLKAGMIINIPEGTAILASSTPPVSLPISAKGLLSSLVVNQQKEMVFLAPFTEEEFTNYSQSKEKNSEIKSNFEFYAGVKIAIDSLKKSGILLKYSVYKNQNTNSLEQEFVNLKNRGIEKSNAVLALPNSYYYEKLGTYLSQHHVPYILTNPADNKISSTAYLALPSYAYLRKLVLDYLVAKNQNIIVVSDFAKKESENYIAENYPMVKLVAFDNKGTFNSEAIKSVLHNNQKNFIVFNTNDTGLILSVTTLLLKESKEYESQIALLEPKEMLKDETLSDMRFRVLKMIYPSQYHPASHKKIENFKQKFLQRYGFEVSREAINGFDITFDVLTRLFQQENFATIAKKYKTEQIGLKFQYVERLNQGCFNESGFILQFDEEANDRIIN